MTQDDLKKFIDSPPSGFEQLAFRYRQAIAARQQEETKIKSFQEALSKAQQEYLKMLGLEKGFFESIAALEEVISSSRKETQ